MRSSFLPSDTAGHFPEQHEHNSIFQLATRLRNSHSRSDDAFCSISSVSWSSSSTTRIVMDDTTISHTKLIQVSFRASVSEILSSHWTTRETTERTGQFAPTSAQGRSSCAATPQGYDDPRFPLQTCSPVPVHVTLRTCNSHRTMRCAKQLFLIPHDTMT